MNPNHTQSIIVYRNPMEQQFWESGMIVPLGAGMLTFLIVTYSLAMAMEKFAWNWSRRHGAAGGYIAAGAGFLAAAFVFWKLMVIVA